MLNYKEPLLLKNVSINKEEKNTLVSDQKLVVTRTHRCIVDIRRVSIIDVSLNNELPWITEVVEICHYFLFVCNPVVLPIKS